MRHFHNGRQMGGMHAPRGFCLRPPRNNPAGMPPHQVRGGFSQQVDRRGVDILYTLAMVNYNQAVRHVSESGLQGHGDDIRAPTTQEPDDGGRNGADDETG